VYAQTPPRRLLFLSILAALLGAAGGGAAWVLLHLIGLITNLALFHRFGWELPPSSALRASPWIVVAAVAGAFVVSLLAKWAPVIRGHGIPETMEAVLLRQSRISPRAALAKPLSAAVAIGTGGPFGAEGPIIVTGGALGSLMGQVFHVSPAERKILLACGAAAGMSATFGAPLASVVLAIELLLFEFSTRAFVPLVVASSVAAGFHSALFGSGPLFSVPAHDYAGLAMLPWFVVLGVACGLLAVIVSKGLFLVEDGFRRLPVSDFWHPVIGAVGFSLVGLLMPRVLGVGYDAIGDVLNDKLAVGVIAVLAVAKLVAWWIALGSGTSGGTLAPLLLIGGAFGSLVGSLAATLAPGLGLSPGAFAVVGMAATFGASTRATFTSIVFLFELTRDYQVIVPLMLAAVVADLIAAALMRETLMTEKLARRGLRVQTEYEVDVLRTTSVREVMTREVQTLPADATVGDARRKILAGPHSAYPLVDAEGRCVGMVSRGDLLKRPAEDSEPLTAVASRDVVSVSPGDAVFRALQRILEEEVERQGGHVAPLILRGVGLQGVEIDAGHALAEGGDGFLVGRDHHVLAVGNAAFEAARAVGGAGPAALFRAPDGVVGGAAETAGGLDARADLDRLDGVDREDGLGQAAVELLVPLHVRAEPHGHVVGDHGDGAAEGVPLVLRLFDEAHHLGLQRAVDGAQGRGFVHLEQVFPVGHGPVHADRSQEADAALDLDAEFGEEHPGQGPGRHARRGLSRRGAFQDVA
jgi:CIC family chloride channel protein